MKCCIDAPAPSHRFQAVRNLDDIDAELRLIRAVRRTIEQCGGESSTVVVDRLLDDVLTSLVTRWMAGDGEQRPFTVTNTTSF